MRYIANTDEDRAEIFRAIGIRDFEELLSDIPKDLRVREWALGPGLSEMGLLIRLRRIGQRNFHADRFASFLGAGNYDHYIPPIVNQLASRGEFITSYTPYQGEASQGTLQFIYEFQSLICLLTKMDVANASMYDGASSLAEAALMVLRTTDRRELLVSELMHPESLQTLRTYCSNMNVRIRIVPHRNGVTDLGFLKENASSETAAVLYENPNFLGYLEKASDLADLAHGAGAKLIASVNPISLSVLVPPGESGADVVCGEGQGLGNPVSYGGPHFGFFAAREEFLRRMPGRICGQTLDVTGERAFVLTLQAREQHIRRDKATSNICTNHSLCALRATIFLSLLGEKGFRKLGELNVERSHQAFNILRKLRSVKVFSDEPFFNEFTLRIEKDPHLLAKSFWEHRILGPLHLARFGKQWQRHYLVAVTEQRTPEEMERLAAAIRKA